MGLFVLLVLLTGTVMAAETPAPEPTDDAPVDDRDTSADAVAA